MGRLKSVKEGRIEKSILRMRKKVKGNIRLNTVFDVVEEIEGVYVNRRLVCSKLRQKGWIVSIDGVDMLVEKKRK
jgi:tRNA splicing endonuclease